MIARLIVVKFKSAISAYLQPFLQQNKNKTMSPCYKPILAATIPKHYSSLVLGSRNFVMCQKVQSGLFAEHGERRRKWDNKGFFMMSMERETEKVR